MIGIIGFGRFGRLMAGYLARDYKIKAFNRSDKTEAMIGMGAEPATLKDVCRQETVILSVPISYMRETLKRIAPLLQPGTLVIDVCSVKVYPVGWMKELLPPRSHCWGRTPCSARTAPRNHSLTGKSFSPEYESKTSIIRK